MPSLSRHSRRPPRGYSPYASFSPSGCTCEVTVVVMPATEAWTATTAARCRSHPRLHRHGKRMFVRRGPFGSFFFAKVAKRKTSRQASSLASMPSPSWPEANIRQQQQRQAITTRPGERVRTRDMESTWPDGIVSVMARPGCNSRGLAPVVRALRG